MSETLRVLHVAQPTTGGVPAVLLGYVRDQVARGWDVLVACPPDTRWLADTAARAGAQVLPWPATRSPGVATVGEVRRLSKLVAREQPAVVHLHSAKAGLAGRLIPRGSHRTVFQPHAWSFLAARGALAAAAIRWERHAARRTDALICVSAAERAVGAGLGIAPPTWTVHNGVDCTHFGPGDRSAARRELGLPDVPTVVCVGRLCAQKGQLDLLAAWPAVARDMPEAQLVLVGDGPDRAAVVAAAAGLPAVTVAGDRSDVARWFAAADVVAAPSRWEGMALVPLEAMAGARSVVTTDVAGAAESVPAAAGAVVPPGDADGFVRALVERLADPARAATEGSAGRLHVALQHDAGRAADEVAGIYLHLVARPTEARVNSERAST